MRRAALLLLLAVSCEREPPATKQPATSASRAIGTPRTAARDYLLAEQARDPSAVPEAATTHRDPEERRLAVKALARMGDSRARERLLSALSDEAPSNVEWAAFGLGHVCAGAEERVARALTLRAAGLLALSRATSGPALASIARALGRCGSSEAERTLRSWLALEPELAEQSALALGVAGMRRGNLDEASFARLLDAAARPERPLESALFAFGRVSVPEGPLRARLVEVAAQRLNAGENARRFALRALGRAGAAAVLPLRAFAERPETPATERAEAIRELVRIGGAAAEHALSELLPALLAMRPGGFTAPADGAELGAVLALLDSLESTQARPALERLARLTLPETEPARRHAVLLRCAAARVLADKSSLQADLAACDPDPEGRSGKLAVLRVLDRGELTGERARRHETLSRDADPVVRQRALELLARHPEVPDAVELLARGLSDSAPGPLAVTAELLAEHPDRARARPKAGQDARPEPKLLELLATSFRLQQKTPNLEVRSSLIDAAGALGVLLLKPDIARDCTSDNPTLRAHAARALRAFGEQSPRCEARDHPGLPPEELAKLETSVARLEFETDAGKLWLELDPKSAPVAVTRVLELAASGFFDGMSVHRVVPGFVTQFGDPGGDGYGGVERRALRSELAPGEFEPGAVGIALSGPDTGSSQLFVALGRYPHLDGEYSRIGRAGPGWERLVLGDRIQRVSRTPER